MEKTYAAEPGARAAVSCGLRAPLPVDLPVPTLPVADPVLVVAITMLILLVGPLLFERFRVPGLVGLIALGAVAGPSVTGLLERDATFTLLGTFGLLYLMFVAGLTLDLAEFRKARGTAIAFGTLSFGLPMVLALAVAPIALGYGWPAAALLGSIVGSHTLLALPVVQRLGIARNRAMVIATGATLVTDLLSLVVLAVVQGVERGEAGASFWLRFGGLAIVWGAFVMLVVPRVARAFFRRVRREDDLAFAFLLATVFLSAWLAGLVGLAPIIGAFLAGIALNPLVPRQSPLMTRLTFVGNAVFIPFFLVSVGLLVDVAVLGSPRVWVLAGVFTALVFVGKGGSSLLGRVLFGFNRDEAWTVAGLTIPQAAATLAVTLIGFEIELFSQEVVNAVVLLIVVSCLVGPSLARAAGRRVARADADAPFDPAEAPERILVPLANPETAEELMELALLLRSPTSEEPIFPIAVARGGHDEATHVAAAERLMERATLHAASASVPCQPTVRIDDNATAGLVRGARELRASEIVAGWTGRPSPGAVVFGGVLDGLLEQSRAMIVVSRLERPLASAKRLVVAVPPGMLHEAGFARAARSLKMFAAQKTLRLLVLTPGDEAQAVSDAFAATAPRSTTAEVHPLDEWSALIKTLDEIVATGDVLALLSVRRGAVAWRPALHRMPRVLARRFASLDLLTVYLSEADVASYVTDVLTPGGDDFALPPEHVTLGLPTGEAGALLRRLLYGGFPDRPSVAARLADAFAAHPDDDAPEIMPGVVFYHAHTADVEAPQVFVGVCPGGTPLPHTSGPAYVLLVLLAPVGMAPDAYLRTLAVTAQLVRSEATVEALVDAETPEEAAALLLAGLRADAEA